MKNNKKLNGKLLPESEKKFLVYIRNQCSI
jgi:hypothetical protein